MFSRTFRSTVQPVELARKLAKEMDDHKTISIHRVYVPDEYTVFLNPADREQFAAYETQMRNELVEYLVEHARREGYSTATRPARSDGYNRSKRFSELMNNRSKLSTKFRVQALACSFRNPTN